MLMRIAFVAGILAQQAGFEVASVRVNGDAAARPRVDVTTTGRYTATAITLHEMIRYAYGVQLSQIVGGPPWAATTRFDVVARTEQPLDGGPNAVRPMVRALLAERFGLRVRDEYREMDAFVLTVARPGLLGPRLQPTAADCSAPQPSAGTPPARAREGWPPCGLVSIRNTTDANGQPGERTLRWSAITMPAFASTLYGTLGRPVVDQTGLSAAYDLEYSYLPLPGAGARADGASDIPTVTVALEEQLGLRVRAQRAPVPVVVIDAAEYPTPD